MFTTHYFEKRLQIPSLSHMKAEASLANDNTSLARPQKRNKTLQLFFPIKSNTGYNNVLKYYESMETNWAETETDWQIICCGYVFQGKQFFLFDGMNLLVSMLKRKVKEKYK